MPGKRSNLNPEPDFALNQIEREEKLNMKLLREIVIRVCRLGSCRVGDPNKTRAIAVKAVDVNERKTPYFFAVLTDKHKGFHKSVGTQGFSLQVAFNKEYNIEPIGNDWKSDDFHYEKKNQIWWRKDHIQDTDINSIMDVVAKARNSFL